MASVFGHKVEVDWSKFTPGSSFFIPCIDREGVEKEIKMKLYEVPAKTWIRVDGERSTRCLKVMRGCYEVYSAQFR